MSDVRAQMIREIDAQIAELGVELRCLDVAGEEEWMGEGGRSFLGYRWVESDGYQEKETWIEANWDELVENFKRTRADTSGINGNRRFVTVDPITKQQTRHRVRPEFVEFINDAFRVAKARRIQRQTMRTERGHKSYDENDDTDPGKKDTGRSWNFRGARATDD